MTFSSSMLLSLFVIAAAAVVSTAAAFPVEQEEIVLCSLCPSGVSIVPGREKLLVQKLKNEETCGSVQLKMTSYKVSSDSKACQQLRLAYQEKCCFADTNEAEDTAVETTTTTKEERDLQYTVPISGTTPYGTVQSYSGPSSTVYQPSASSQVRGPYPACNLCFNGGFPAKQYTLGAVLGYGTHTCGELYYMARNGQIEQRMCNPMQDFMATPCGC